MKVLLINVPCRESLPPTNFPIGLGYIASVLRNAGHEISVLDINAHRYSRETVERLIKEADFDMAATGNLITLYGYTKWLSGVLKKHHPEKFLVIGGALATSAPEIVLGRTEADAIALGEGEATMLELADALGKKRGLEEVKGIWFKKGGKIVKNPPRELMKNLDELPFPAWDLFPVDIYLKYMHIEKLPLSWKCMNISTVRGCPFNCSFCYNVFGVHTARARSPDSIIAEIKALKERYGVKAITFIDNLFITNRTKVLEFCEKMIEQKIGVAWVTSARVDVVDLELLKKMRQAGCAWISYGLESGSQKMLDAMNKSTTVEKMLKAIEATRKAGLFVYGSFMVGTPGETPETIKETVEFIKKIDLFVPGIFIATPYPGSDLYEFALKKGAIPNEEEFISKCGEAFDLTVNVSGMSDAELLKWRSWAAREVISDYRRRHRLEALKMDFTKLRLTVARFGFSGTLKKIAGRAGRAMKKPGKGGG